ncbi:MAG: radical SAM protein [Sandaracinaceae bacterium]|nr:radical SAM protein [Sandaracinaceae bacterium]
MKIRLRTTSASVEMTETLRALRRELAELDADAAIERVGARDVDRALKTTISLCPECLDYVPALVFERRGRVLAAKRCPTHGDTEALLEGDAAFYRLSNKDKNGRRFAEDRVFRIPEWSPPGADACCGPGQTCGDPDALGAGVTDQRNNRTCTVLVEVTDACNLACRVCYSDSKGDRFLPFETFVRHLDRMLEKKGRLESVQLTGGEASLHPRFWDFVDHLYREERVTKIYLPTNGLTFAKPAESDRLVQYADKLMVLLQMDGLTRETNQTLRDADPVRIRKRLIARLDAAGVPMQLTVTVAQDVNDDELGAVIDLGLEHAMVKVIALQPVTWSGRYDLDVDPMRRLTLSDIAKRVLEQANVRARREDWLPIPCSHPNCGWITVFVRRFGVVHNVMRYVDLEEAMDDVAYKTLLSTAELRNVIGKKGRGVLQTLARTLGGKVIRSTDMFSVAIKPFMDRYSYDQDRIDNCCHHITDTRGNLLSFCEYNAIGRQHDPWTRLPTLEGARAPAARADAVVTREP